MTSDADKILIVNADDFGQSPGINRGILRAHEDGIVTSTSVMVRWPAAAEVTSVVRSHPKLSLGLHVDLGEWIFRDGQWVEHYRVLGPADLERPETVSAEVAAQLGRFRELAGIDPTHLDSHQHAHRDEPLRSILLALAEELKIPLRHFDPGLRYCGDFYGQSAKGYPYPPGITVDALLHILHNLPAGRTELCCHPALGPLDFDSQYRSERETETQALCDPKLKLALAENGIRLASFRSPR
jgi:predicted glycoside hydrolase/deacetylase ChbG (UPF0249 family)